MELALVHGEGLLVPERMIVAPSVGVFRACSATTSRGSARRRGADCRCDRRAREPRPPSAARSAAASPACSPTTANAASGRARRLVASRIAVRACISGWGTAVPEKLVTNAELEARVDTTDEWIVERTGIRERRSRGARPRPPHRSRSTPAPPRSSTPGSRPTRSTCSSSPPPRPEQPIPHTGAFVGEGLGLRCGSFDLSAGCAGFVYMLVVGSSLLATGNLDHVLDRRLRDAQPRRRPRRPGDVHPLRRRRRRCRAQPLTRRRARRPRLGPRAATARPPACSRSRAGGSRLPATPETIAAGEQYLKMQGQEVFRRAVRVVVDSARTTLDRAGVAPADVDWFVPHQANIRIIESAASRLGIARRPDDREHRPLRQHVGGVDPARARRSGRRRTAARRRPRAHVGLRRRHDLGQRARPLGKAWST